MRTPTDGEEATVAGLTRGADGIDHSATIGQPIQDDAPHTTWTRTDPIFL